MAKLLYSATMSLDGFIAGPDGDMSWLTEHLGPNPTVDQVIGEIGALLVGNRTFRGDDPHKGTAKEGKPFGRRGRRYIPVSIDASYEPISRNALTFVPPARTVQSSGASDSRALPSRRGA